MNRFVWYLHGYRRVQISGASPDWMLNRLAKGRVPFWDLVWIDAFTVQISIFPRDMQRTVRLVSAAMCEIKDIEAHGFYTTFSGVFRRPVLWIGMILSLIVLFIGQNYIFFYEVTGNEAVPSGQILQTLEELGVDVGVFGPNIKPKWIKDHILNEIPKLQWITVTQNGCMAKVVVRERPQKSEAVDRKGFANVLAAKDGVITKQYILEGQALKKPGDAVLKGDILVSGVVDLETKFSVVYAQAEVYANTWYDKTVISPVQYLKKQPESKSRRCIWLQFGKRKIKILGNSGISYADCDKMISRKNLTLPGGRKLPVSVITEIFQPYHTELFTPDEEQLYVTMKNTGLKSIKAQLCAGEILKAEEDFAQSSDRFCLRLRLKCHEMIAQTQIGKWNNEDFEHDRKNSQRRANGAAY